MTLAFDLSGVLFSNLPPRYIREGIDDVLLGQLPVKDYLARYDLPDVRFSMNDLVFSDIVRLSKKYPLAVISNHAKAWRESLEKTYRYEKYFQTLVYSDQEGYMKPDVRLFQILQSRCGVPFEQITLIDDTKENIEMAKQLGMKTYTYKRGHISL